MGCRRFGYAVLVCMFGLEGWSWPTSARAETVTASATTLISGRQDPRDGSVHTVVPFLELIAINARDVRNPLFKDLNLVMTGWGEATAGSPYDGRHAQGDVDLAYLEGTLGRGVLGVRFGRQFVIPGAGAMVHMDGVSAAVHMGLGFGLVGYFGSPVSPRLSFDRGDVVGGGRFFWRKSYATEVGVSMIELRGQGELGRRDMALDLRYQPLTALALTGLARFSLAESRLVEGDATVSFLPHRAFDISAEIRRTAPDLFLPRYSLFSVFTQERRDEVGGYLTVRPFRVLELLGDFRAVHVEDGWGLSGSARAAFRLNDAGWTRFGAEFRRLDSSTQSYQMVRLYGSRRLGTRLGTTADVQAVDLEKPVNGQTKSYFATLNLIWDTTSTWRVVLTGVASSTPYASARYEGLLKVVYGGGRVFIEERRP